jgi:putative transposase
MDFVAYKIYPHNPPHLLIDGAKYWVTGSAYRHRPLFREHATKSKMLEVLQKTAEKLGWRIDDWVILNDHYYLMLESPDYTVKGSGPKTIADFMNNFHRFTALWIRKNNNSFKNVKRIFNNYWDTCITYERSYFARINYLYFNPVKHGYVDHPAKYPFGSYFYRVKQEKIYLEGLVRKHPFDQLDLE